MDSNLFLERLRDLPIEEGRIYIRDHITELADYKDVGEAMENEALRLLYTPFVSLKLAELLIYYGNYVEHDLSHALGLKAKGDALMLIGHYQAALECSDMAGDEFLRLGDDGNWARSRIGWIMSCAWIGRVEEALQAAARAREVFLRLEEPYWVCAIDHNTALIYDYIGRYADALTLYERLRATYLNITDYDPVSIKQRIALAEMNQAIDLAMLGNFEESYQLQQQALASFVALNERSCAISAEINLADLDYLQGFYGSALRHYYHALDELVQYNIDEPLQLPELKFCIAKCLVKLNRVQEACQLAKEAVESYRKTELSLSTGNALREYATTLIASGKSEEALDVLDEAWMLLKKGRFDPLAYLTKSQQAELLLKTGFVTSAYEQAGLARTYFETQGLVVYAVRCTLVMANALVEKARKARLHETKERQFKYLQESISLCQEIASQARQYHLQEDVYKSYYLLGQIFEVLEHSTNAARYYRAAIAQIERMLDDLIYDLSPSFLQSTWAVYEDMISLCLEQAQPERAFGYFEQARSMILRQYLNKSRATQNYAPEKSQNTTITVAQQYHAEILRIQYELRKEQENHRSSSILLADFDLTVSPHIDRAVIQQEVARCEEKISELTERLHLYQSNPRSASTRKGHISRKVEKLDIELLNRRLTSDQILLAYFMHQGKLLIFALTKDCMVTRQLLSSQEELEELLLLFHARLDPSVESGFHPSMEPIMRGLLNKLYNILMRSVADLLPRPHGHLTIVPYGPLHKFPFHALHDGSHYLIEDYQINYLPASSLLAHLGTSDNKFISHSGDGEPFARPPLVFGYSGNSYLEHIHDEARAVASLLRGQCYLDGEATISRLIELAPGSPIIHLATHGKSRLDAPNFSYVRLADGQLNAIDAFDLDLRGCELVTLSGCETGLALSGGGDEQLGLGRAFLAAGATSLVMSLWPVEDNATNQLMQRFYQHLLQGESKIQALRAAQCSFLQEAKSIHLHPYFWAAFRLVGETAPLKYTKTREQLPTSEPLKK